MTSRPRKTAAELMAELEADADFRRQRAERERTHEREVAANRAAERPVLDRVREATGVAVASLAELRQHSGPDLRAVLIDELDRVDRLDVKRGIIGAIPARWVTSADVTRLLDEFDRAGDGEDGDGLRWSIASALVDMGHAADPGELIRRLQDPANGQARQMLALAVGATGDPTVVPPLIALLDDEVVDGHVVKALGELRAAVAREPILRLRDDPRDWVRDEVRRALARLPPT